MKQCNYFFQERKSQAEENKKAQIQYLSEQYVQYLSRTEKMGELQNNPNVQHLLKETEESFFNQSPKHQVLLNQYFMGQLNSKLSFLDSVQDYNEQQDNDYVKLTFRAQYLQEYGHVLLKWVKRYTPDERTILSKLQYLLKHGMYNEAHFQSQILQIEEIQVPYQTKGPLKQIAFEKIKIQIEDTMKQIIPKETIQKIICQDIQFRQQYETLSIFVDLQESVRDQLMEWVFYQFQLEKQMHSCYSSQSSFVKNESEESKELRKQLEARQVVYLLYPRNIHQLQALVVDLQENSMIKCTLEEDDGAALLLAIQNYFDEEYFYQTSFLDIDGYKYGIKDMKNASRSGRIQSHKTGADQKGVVGKGVVGKGEGVVGKGEGKGEGEGEGKGKGEGERKRKRDSCGTRLYLEDLRLLTSRCMDRLVRTWLKSMGLKDIDQVTRSLYQLSREVASYYKQDDFFLLFNQGYLRLNFILTRMALIRIRSYLNYYIYYEREVEEETLEYNDCFIEILDIENQQVIYDNLEIKNKEYLEKVERRVAFCIQNRKAAMKKERREKEENDRKNIRTGKEEVGEEVGEEEVEEEVGEDQEKSVHNKQKSIIEIFDEKYNEIQKKDGFDRQYLVTKILTYEQKFHYQKIVYLELIRVINRNTSKSGLLEDLMMISQRVIGQEVRLEFFTDRFLDVYLKEVEILELKVFLINYIISYYKGKGIEVEYSLLARFVISYEEQLQLIFDKCRNKFLVVEALEIEKKYLDLLLYAFQGVMKGEYLQGFERLLINQEFSYEILEKDLMIMSKMFRKDHFRNDFNNQFNDQDIKDVSRLVLDYENDYYFCIIKYLEYEQKRMKVLKYLTKASFYLQLQTQQHSECQDNSSIQHLVMAQKENILELKNQLFNYMEVNLKKEKNNILDLAQYQTYVICSFKSQELNNITEITYNLRNLAQTSCQINNIYFEEIFNQYNYDKFLMVQKIKRDKEEYFRNSFSIKEELIKKFNSKQKNNSNFAQKILIPKDQLSLSNMNIIKKVQEYNATIQKINIKIVPTEQTQTRNLMRLIYNNVQAEQIRIMNAELVFSLSKVYQRMFFKKNEQSQKIFEFQRLKEMKSNMTKQQQEEKRRKSHVVLMRVHQQMNKKIKKNQDSDSARNQSSSYANSKSQKENESDEEIQNIRENPNQNDYFDMDDSINDLFRIPSIEVILEMDHKDTCKVFMEEDLIEQKNHFLMSIQKEMQQEDQNYQESEEGEQQQNMKKINKQKLTNRQKYLIQNKKNAFINSKLYILQEILFRFLNILQNQQFLLYLQCHKGEDFIYYNSGLLRDQSQTVQYQFEDIQFFPNLDVNQLRIEQAFDNLYERLRTIKKSTLDYVKEQQLANANLLQETINNNTIKFLKKIHQIDYSLLQNWTINQLRQQNPKEKFSKEQLSLLMFLFKSSFQQINVNKDLCRNDVQNIIKKEKQKINYNNQHLSKKYYDQEQIEQMMINETFLLRNDKKHNKKHSIIDHIAYNVNNKDNYLRYFVIHLFDLFESKSIKNIYEKLVESQIQLRNIFSDQKQTFSKTSNNTSTNLKKKKQYSQIESDNNQKIDDYQIMKKVSQNLKLKIKYIFLVEIYLFLKNKNYNIFNQIEEKQQYQELEGEIQLLNLEDNENNTLYEQKQEDKQGLEIEIEDFEEYHVQTSQLEIRMESEEDEEIHMLTEQNQIANRVNIIFYLIEMQLYKQSQEFYKQMNQQMSSDFGQLLGEVQSDTGVFSIILNRIMTQGCQIKVSNKGLGIVIEQESLKGNMEMLSSIILEQQSEVFNRLVVHEQERNYMVKRQLEMNHMLNQSYNRKATDIEKYFYELVETKVAQYTNELNFNLEQTKNKVEYMKGDELLKLQTIKKDILAIFRDMHRDNQLDIKNTDSKFTDYRIGINLDITRFIDTVKNHQRSFIKNSLQMMVGGGGGGGGQGETQKGEGETQKGIGGEDMESMVSEVFVTQNLETSSVMENKKTKPKHRLQQLIILMRVFYIFKLQIKQDKQSRLIASQFSQMVSNEELWHSIDELQKKELQLRQVQIEHTKKIAIQQNHNNQLKKDIKEQTVSKISKYRQNTLQRSRGLEVQFKIKNFMKNRHLQFLRGSNNNQSETQIGMAGINKSIQISAKQQAEQMNSFGVNMGSQLENNWQGKGNNYNIKSNCQTLQSQEMERSEMQKSNDGKSEMMASHYKSDKMNKRNKLEAITNTQNMKMSKKSVNNINVQSQGKFRLSHL